MDNQNIFSKIISFVNNYFILILILVLVSIGVFSFIRGNGKATSNIGSAQQRINAGSDLNNPVEGQAAPADSQPNSDQNNSGMPLPNDTDHYRGNPDAPIKLVEYSDFECPFCKRLHPTLKAIIEKYPEDVVWVYRHFPLSEHRYALEAAQASECVASIAGEDKFWEYNDALFANASGGLNPDKLFRIAGDIGIDAIAVESCLNSEEKKTLVQAMQQGGLRAGVSGTPNIVLVTDQGVQGLIPGALPQPQLEEIIQDFL